MGKLLTFNHKTDIYDLCTNVFAQPGHSYCEIPYELDQQLQWFFQSEKFFLETKTELIQKLRDGLRFGHMDEYGNASRFVSGLKNLLGVPLVSVHIRRGDYLKFKGVHDTCSVDYYDKALFLMKEKLGDFHPVFISDDIEWCKKVFGETRTYSTFTDELEDLSLMVECDHNIIANSSFSWWGAYLNDNPDKIIIGPEKWFGPNGPQDQQDIIPENWIKI